MNNIDNYLTEDIINEYKALIPISNMNIKDFLNNDEVVANIKSDVDTIIDINKLDNLNISRDTIERFFITKLIEKLIKSFAA